MVGDKHKRVAVLMGGDSSEREVSLRSGAAVNAGLLASGYDALPVVVENGQVALPDGITAVFIALHGAYGEDGGIQSTLNESGVPYTGSGAEASRIAFDKLLTKQVLASHGIPTPDYETRDDASLPQMPFPVVVKPPREGSSVGVHRVDTVGQWAAAAADVLSHGSSILVESFIAGRELTVGVLDGSPLPIVEIVAPDGWYDYQAKYTKGASRYLVPAALDPDLRDRCQSLAVSVYEAIGCRGAARVDIRLSEASIPYVLEVNTIPGFTETSLLPMAALAAGIPFASLCDRILKTAAVDGGLL